MTIPLDDLDEQELRDLIRAIRMADSMVAAMPDAGVLVEVLTSDLDDCVVVALLAHCPSKKVITSIVSRLGGTLEHVPESLRDRDVCLAAIRMDWRSLAHVPHPIRDIEVCAEAVKRRAMTYPVFRTYGDQTAHTIGDLAARIPRDDLGEIERLVPGPVMAEVLGTRLPAVRKGATT